MAEEYDHQVLTDMKVRLPKKVRVSRSYSEKVVVIRQNNMIRQSLQHEIRARMYKVPVEILDQRLGTQLHNHLL